MDSLQATEGMSPAIDVDKLTSQFIRLRDFKDKINAEHAKRVGEINKVLDEIGGKLLKHLQDTNQHSGKCESGTFYQNEKRSASISDPSTFRDWVIMNAGFELVDWKANSPNCWSYMEHNHGKAPPGVRLSSYVSIGVRRAGEKE